MNNGIFIYDLDLKKFIYVNKYVKKYSEFRPAANLLIQNPNSPNLLIQDQEGLISNSNSKIKHKPNSRKRKTHNLSERN